MFEKPKPRDILGLLVATLTILLAAHRAGSAERPSAIPAAHEAPQGQSKSEHKALPVPELTAGERTAAINDLRSKSLLFPIKGFDISKIKNSFNEMRGNERHGASDILAPRGTPVIAVDDGTIAKLFLSRFGGITIYEFDKQKKYVYYYAHLEKYADGLKDGDKISRGQVIGYVGTSGDAPKNTPHLHLCISVPRPEKQWWQTAPVDPYEIFKAEPK